MKMSSTIMESYENQGYESVDPLASPSDGSNVTPNTEYSPPSSPFPKQRLLHDSRSAAKKKLASLTLEEKVCITSKRPSHAKYTIGLPSHSRRLWRTKSIPEKGIPAIKTSDGPNGARGGIFVGGTKVCMPNVSCTIPISNDTKHRPLYFHVAYL